VVRLVEAQSEAEAKENAEARIFEEWEAEKHCDTGVRPKLKFTKIRRLGFFGRIQARESGYVYHSGGLTGD
jgi:hypothetical protein